MESENELFLGKKEGDLGLLGEEDKWLLSCGAVFYRGGKIKEGGLNLRMAGTFSWVINSCLLI